MELSSPYPFIDIVRMKRNIKSMSDRLSKSGIAHWPHSKTHKSIEIARMQLEFGAAGITVAKLSEAEVMCAGGIGPLLLAYPIIGSDKLQRLQRLVRTTTIRTIVDSVAVANGLSEAGEAAGQPIDVLIEVDTGSRRGGVQPGQALLELARHIGELSGIQLKGVFAYSGQIYGSGSVQEIMLHAEQESKWLSESLALLNSFGFNVSVASGGSTPSSFFPEQLRGLTESRAGNYVFGDRNAVSLGLMTEEDCALRIRSTVVSCPLPGFATIDAGSKTLTSDLSVADQRYGSIVGKPGVALVKLNEEHGYLRYDPDMYSFQVGDIVEMIPNHSCVIPNLYDRIAVIHDQQMIGYYNVDARGMNF